MVLSRVRSLYRYPLLYQTLLAIYLGKLIFSSLSLTNRADWKPVQKLVYLVPDGKMNSAKEYCTVKFNKCVERQPYYYCNCFSLRKILPIGTDITCHNGVTCCPGIP